MELYQLRTFVTVAEEGNLTRAARRLFMTPPSVSAHIKALEDELNVTLFVRTARGMEITEQGTLLKASAEQTLQAAQDIINQATEMQQHLMGSLKFGLNSTPARLRVARLVAALQIDYPGIELSFITSISGKIMDSLNDGSLDAGYIFGVSPCAEIITCRLSPVELVIAGPQVWQTKLLTAGWDDIAAMPWITSSSYCPFELIAGELFRAQGLTRRRTIQTDDEATKRELVEAGLGLSLLERQEAEQACQNGKITIWETEPIRTDLSLVFLARRADDPLIRAVMAAVFKVWENKISNREQ